MDYLGYIEFDDLVRQASRKRKPVILEYPYSNAAQGIRQVAARLTERSQLSLDSFFDTVPGENTVTVKDSLTQ